MIRVILGLALAAAFVTGAAHAQDDDLQKQVEAVERLGRELNDHDQSAWHVTDELMRLAPEARNLPIAYITERVDLEHVRTVFLIMDGEPPSVLFTGVVKGSEVVSTEDFRKRADPVHATEAQAAQLNAALAVRQATRSGLCGKPVNTVVLPGAADGEFDVYALASETEQNVVQMGGHIRLTIGADGQMVENSLREYSASCIAMRKSANSVGLMITLPPAISDIPTEIHVFKSLSHDTPIFVGTGGRVWEVADGRIRLTPPAPARAN